ncbi:tyrosine-type recombinase/integrase [Gilliamella sp. B2838]|uniref:tyrosine-type recombinase/integrase n=1 Tax=Gilliamella sp. B2838 TaxID=2818020 RepID=UPI002269B4FA|nr:site-specific integrase [Gilliamella sp. B2838]MCX8727011.1 site-specific integrase [Gilliamella sp. B2838]
MAHYIIEKRVRADGTPRYRCTVVIKEKTKIIYRESKTFSKQQIAKTWGNNQVSKIEQFGIPEKNDVTKLTVGNLLSKYLSDPNLGEKAGRTKRYVIKMLIESDIANIKLADLKTHHIIEHCRSRIESGTQPATVSHDVSYIKSVLEAARPVYGINIDDTVVKDARPLLIQMNLIGKSQRRTRRPINDELEQLINKLKKRQSHKNSKIPFVDILNFSILSCMRISEVCSLRWDDINYEQKAILVRNRKDPRKKIGNHMLVPLLGDSWNILQSQPKDEVLVFPYNSSSVTAGFQRVRNELGIQDLRYHDLRREGASRLLEQGFSIEEVAQVTGHRNLQTLWNIYISLFPNSLHNKFDKINSQDK